MSQLASAHCTTCYGTGEIVNDQGPMTCPHCFGEGATVGGVAKVEWRLREIERVHRGSGQESEADVLWLVHELRRSRELLLHVMAMCEDASPEALAHDIKYRINDVLALYPAKPT